MIIYQCNECGELSGPIVCKGFLPYAPKGWQIIADESTNDDAVYHFCPKHNRKLPKGKK